MTGIIQGHYSGSFEPWAYGRYINCAFNPGFGFRVFGHPDIMDFNKDLIQRVNHKDIPRVKWLEHWKSLLDDGIYIQANLNEQYIPGKWAYNLCEYYHDSLVIGYNDEKETFTLFARLADAVIIKTRGVYEHKYLPRISLAHLPLLQKQNKD